MSKLPVVSGRETVRALTKLSFVQVRQSGSHIVLQKRSPATTRTLVVPDHPELAKGTLRTILRKAELSIEDFCKLL
ncbi:MAG: type II toxin-antitoxin system HicA family toxin [Elusimicrobia bacterium]|nr:type II toxin-antitoxin system HicA family toxin [Elusimicrobiota bacterium]